METDDNVKTTKWWFDLSSKEIAILVLLGSYTSAVFTTFYVIQNAVIPHTFTHGLNFGELFSLRYNSAWHTAYFLMSFRVFTVFVVLWLLVFKRVFQNAAGCTVFWITLLFGLFMVEAACVVLMATFSQSCNKVSGFDLNPCNDKRGCCVPEVRNDPMNNCAVTTPCVFPQTFADLTPDPDFQLALAMTIICFFLLIPILVLSVLDSFQNKMEQWIKRK